MKAMMMMTIANIMTKKIMNNDENMKLSMMMMIMGDDNG